MMLGSAAVIKLFRQTSSALGTLVNGLLCSWLTHVQLLSSADFLRPPPSAGWSVLSHGGRCWSPRLAPSRHPPDHLPGSVLDSQLFTVEKHSIGDPQCWNAIKSVVLFSRLHCLMRLDVNLLSLQPMQPDLHSRSRGVASEMMVWEGYDVNCFNSWHVSQEQLMCLFILVQPMPLCIMYSMHVLYFGCRCAPVPAQQIGTADNWPTMAD